MQMNMFDTEAGRKEKEKEDDKLANPFSPDTQFDTVGNPSPKSINPLQSWAEQARAAQEGNQPSTEEAALREQASQYEASPDDSNAIMMSKIAGIIGKGASNYSRAYTGGADQSKEFDDAAKMAEERLKYKENYRKQLIDKAGAMSSLRKERQQMAVTGLQAGIAAQGADIQGKEEAARQQGRDRLQAKVEPGRAAMLNAYAKSKGQDVDFSILSNENAAQIQDLIAKLPDNRAIKTVTETQPDGGYTEYAVTLDTQTGKVLQKVALGSGANAAKNEPLSAVALEIVNKELDARGKDRLNPGANKKDVEAALSAVRLKTGEVTDGVRGSSIKDLIQSKVTAGKPIATAELEARDELSPAQKSFVTGIQAKVQKRNVADITKLDALDKNIELLQKAGTGPDAVAAVKRIVQSTSAKSIGMDAGALSNQDLENIEADKSFLNRFNQWRQTAIWPSNMTESDAKGFLKLMNLAKGKVAEQYNSRHLEFVPELQTKLSGAPAAWIKSPERAGSVATPPTAATTGTVDIIKPDGSRMKIKSEFLQKALDLGAKRG
jgi:hypothetical protein